MVAQMVSASVQCSKGFELEQKKMIAYLSVCLSATSLLSLESNNDFIYVKRRQRFFVKA